MALPQEQQNVTVSEATKKKYLKNLREQIRSLRLAMEKSDAGSAREICHRIRGSASLFGLKELGDACRTMEESSAQEKFDRMVENFQVIEVIVSRSFLMEQP